MMDDTLNFSAFVDRYLDFCRTPSTLFGFIKKILYPDPAWEKLKRLKEEEKANLYEVKACFDAGIPWSLLLYCERYPEYRDNILVFLILDADKNHIDDLIFLFNEQAYDKIYQYLKDNKNHILFDILVNYRESLPWFKKIFYHFFSRAFYTSLMDRLLFQDWRLEGDASSMARWINVLLPSLFVQDYHQKMETYERIIHQREESILSAQYTEVLAKLMMMFPFVPDREFANFLNLDVHAQQKMIQTFNIYMEKHQINGFSGLSTFFSQCDASVEDHFHAALDAQLLEENKTLAPVVSRSCSRDTFGFGPWDTAGQDTHVSLELSLKHAEALHEIAPHAMFFEKARHDHSCKAASADSSKTPKLAV